MSARSGFLGLGSNQGDRRANLQAAVVGLTGQEVEVVASSSVYATDPVGPYPDQPEFLNACLRVRTALEPEALLDRCKAVERGVGRVPGGLPEGPRLIDVDVLLLGDLEHASARMRLPHPEIVRRRFVLIPLLELDPALRLPDGRSLPEALDGLARGQCVRPDGPPLRTG